jgi:recombination protein RecR
VLGGTVPILEKEPERKVRSRELLKTVEKRAKEEGLKEVILAISFNSEGENTAQYIKDILSPLCEKYSLKITLLGRGLSTGTELEYSDSETIKNALKNRQ